MFYLGIDIGKSFHVASLIDDKKKVIFQGFECYGDFSKTELASEEILERVFIEKK